MNATCPQSRHGSANAFTNPFCPENIGGATRILTGGLDIRGGGGEYLGAVPGLRLCSKKQGALRAIVKQAFSLSQGYRRVAVAWHLRPGVSSLGGRHSQRMFNPLRLSNALILLRKSDVCNFNVTAPRKEQRPELRA